MVGPFTLLRHLRNVETRKENVHIVEKRRGWGVTFRIGRKSHVEFIVENRLVSIKKTGYLGWREVDKERMYRK